VEGEGGLGGVAEAVEGQEDSFGVLGGELLDFLEAGLQTGGGDREVDFEVVDERFGVKEFHCLTRVIYL
jgi:hypothetical protein